MEECKETFLGAERVQLNLVAHWPYARVAKQVRNELHIEVAQSDALSEPLVDKRL